MAFDIYEPHQWNRLMARAEKAEDLLADARKDAEAWKNRAEVLVQNLVATHPLPWRVGSDWCVEVIDNSGDIVAKFRTREPADWLVNAARELAATPAAPEPTPDDDTE